MLVVLTALPFIVFASVTLLRDYQSGQEASRQYMQNTSRALMQAVDRDLDTYRAVVATLTSNTLIGRPDLSLFDVRLREVLRSLPEGSIFILADSTGRQVINTAVPFGAPLFQPFNIASIDHVFGRHEPRISELFVEAVTGRPGVSIAVPVVREGAVLYALAIVIPIGLIQKNLSAQKLPDGWLAGIVDPTGTLIARHPHPELYVGKKAAPLLVEGIRRVAEGTVETPSLENIIVSSTWSRSDFSGWATAVAQPRSDFIAPLVNKLFWLGGGGLALLLAGIACSLILGRRIAYQMTGLTKGAVAMGHGLPVDVPDSGIEEIREIGSALALGSSELRSSRERQDLIMAELDHRVRNTLAVVQSLLRLSAKEGQSKEDFVPSAIGRIDALAAAHGILTQTQWRGGSLRQLISDELRAYMSRDSNRVVVDGADVLLSPKPAISVALVLHELATNAVKYGALSTPEGRVRISLTANEQGPTPRLIIVWLEAGGPSVAKPTREGFGTKLIRSSLTSEFGASVTLEFSPEGAMCTVILPLHLVATLNPRDDQPDTPRRDANSEKAGHRLNGRILLVDDETLIGMDMKATLEEAGAIVLGPATQLDSALALAASERFDAALLDINLSGQLVFPFADRLLDQGVPFAFLSGYGKETMVPARFKQVPVLQKPVRSEELVELAVKLIAAPRSTSAFYSAGARAASPACIALAGAPAR